MTQTVIPFLFMRGGSSRGPFIRRQDLPEDLEDLARVLVAMIGSGHPLNIDGIGGGASVTTKVAMLSASTDEWADVDYFFAQVGVENGRVDFKPTCGNILIGVGPAAIEMGLVAAQRDVTEVKIRAVNTGARVQSRVQTPGGIVTYAGDAQVDGVPGTAAPIEVMFRDVVGAATGTMFPTGNRMEVVQGVEVTCIDVAMPMVIARADAFGLTGHEGYTELDENTEFFDRMEAIRREAGARMGIRNVAESVTPKFGLVAPAANGGSAAVRYFMPLTTHPSLAVTGSQALGACLLCPGTVADAILRPRPTSPATLFLEHPMGQLEVTIEYDLDGDQLELHSAGLVRTARKLAAGEVFVSASCWSP